MLFSEPNSFKTGEKRVDVHEDEFSGASGVTSGWSTRCRDTLDGSLKEFLGAEAIGEHAST
jgi:hypothetical protein